ncbi:MAG: type II toxin-antitoxin system VapC family toxin [Candidatus Sulfotelmatobacter sp.]
MAGRARAVERPLAFWDASALVPLCAHQELTPRVVALYRSYGAVVWWATAVEIASALRRLVRMKQLTPDDWATSRGLASELAESWRVVQPSNALRARAAQLVDRYDLRAADALQLGAALEWCEGMPQDRVFLAADQRLREAAVLSGFDGRRI